MAWDWAWVQETRCLLLTNHLEVPHSICTDHSFTKCFTSFLDPKSFYLMTSLISKAPYLGLGPALNFLVLPGVLVVLVLQALV